MKAKDTVISMPEMKNVSLCIQMENILLEQAEITWKAREPEIAEARKAGIKEMVEGLLKWRGRINYSNGTVTFVVPMPILEQWEAFSKQEVKDENDKP